MADVMWPLYILPAHMARRIIDSTAAFSSPSTGFTRTSSLYGVRRWGVSIERDWLRLTERAAILSLIADLDGRAGRIVIPTFDYVKGGAFPAPEVLANNTFDVIGTWASGANASLALSNRVLRSTRTDTATSNLLYTPSATVVANANYVVRMLVRQGKGLATSSMLIGAGSTQSNYSYGSGSGQTGFAFRTFPFVPTSTTAFGAFQSSATGVAIGDYLDFLYVSMSRCLLVAGASQSGSALNVDGYSGTLAGALLAGDMVEIILPTFSQLVQLTANLDLNSSGAGYMRFKPALRYVPADNAPIIINQPMGRYMSSDGTMEWDNKLGMFSDVSLNFEEAIGS